MHQPGKLLLQPARQVDVVIPLQYVCHPPLAGLTVNAHHFFVAPPQIMRVDRQIGHIPDIAVLAPYQTLANRILMTAGKSRKNQFAHIGVARVSGNIRAAFHHLANFRHALEIEFGIDPLGVKIHGHGNQVHIPGALTIAHQGAFDAVGAGHHTELRRRHRAAAVVVGMQADSDMFALLDALTNALHLIGKNIGAGHLNGGRQVDNHFLPVFRLPHGIDRVDNLNRVIGFSAGKTLGRILKHPVSIRVLRGLFFHQPGAGDGYLLNTFFVHRENLFALDDGGRIVDMNNGPTGTL